MSWTPAQLREYEQRRAAAVPIAPRQKFGNKSVTIDGHVFDSKKEGDRYLLLKMRERLKEIDRLELQPVFDIYHRIFESVPGHPEWLREIGREHIGDYTADFRYWERMPGGGEVLRVEDVKSKATKTEAYGLRKKLVEALHGVTIMEI